MGTYILKCVHPDCGKIYETDNFRLKCDNEISGEHSPAFLKTIYDKKKITPKNLPGIFKFIDWLPCGNNYFDIEGRPVAYRSEGLADYLGLSDLWIIYSGFWPEKGADIVTRTFKQLESPATLIRYFNTSSKPMPLIISSAGNTANSFNYVANKLAIPLYFVIPVSGMKKLRLPFKTNPVSIAVEGDYADAIKLADEISDKTGLFREGGARNVARRDGMGVAMLEAVTTSGYLFDHYFQAVGSASGGIAAWESVLRLMEDSRFGDTKTKLHLAQNLPFTPLADSWELGLKSLIDIPEDTAKRDIEQVIAQVLTNRRPPYSICGGVRDALIDTNGLMYRIDNKDAFDASRIFRATEGIDIGPAASVATGALIQAVNKKQIKKDEKILLHITGGGLEAQLQHFGNVIYEPETIVVRPFDLDFVLEKLGDISPIELDSQYLKSI